MVKKNVGYFRKAVKDLGFSVNGVDMVVHPDPTISTELLKVSTSTMQGEEAHTYVTLRSLLKDGAPDHLAVKNQTTFENLISRITAAYVSDKNQQALSELQRQAQSAIDDLVGDAIKPDIVSDKGFLYLQHPVHSMIREKVDGEKLQQQIEKFSDVCGDINTHIEELQKIGASVVFEVDEKTGACNKVVVKRDSAKDKTQGVTKASEIAGTLRKLVKSLSQSAKDKAEVVEDQPVVPPPSAPVVPPAAKAAAPASIVSPPVASAVQAPAVLGLAAAPVTKAPSPQEARSTKPVVIMLDANILVHMATRRDPKNPETNLLPMLEWLAKLPNVTLVVTSTVADFESRGLIADPKKPTGFRCVNPMFDPDKVADKLGFPNKVNQGSDLGEFFRSAYRVRKMPEGEGVQIIAPKGQKANPHLVIAETEACREFIKEIDDTESLKDATKGDVGEITMAYLLQDEMLFQNASVVVVSEDNNCLKWTTDTPTQHGQSLTTAGLSDLVMAVCRHHPEFYTEKLFENAGALLKATELACDAANVDGRSSNHFHTKKMIGCGTDLKSAEFIGDVVARGVALQNAGIKVELPLHTLMEEEKARLAANSKRSQCRLGVMLQSLMTDYKISYEQLAEKINDLNKVDVEPKTPAITFEILRDYISGKSCPDQDTHYALMAALVWESHMPPPKKQEATDKLMAAWKVRYEMRETLPIEVGKHEYHTYGDVLSGVVGSARALDAVIHILEQYCAKSAKPLDIDALTALCTTAVRKDPKQMLGLIRAIESLSGVALTEDEKQTLFRTMIEENNGHAKATGKH